MSYKLSNAKICKDQICYKISFLLVKNIQETVILETPFLALLYPFIVDNLAITTKTLDCEVKFEFLDQPKIRDLNSVQSKDISFINLIKNKRKHINFINKEIHFKRIEEQLQSSCVQEKIKIRQNKFTKDLCSKQLNAFWKRKIHTISLSYESDFKEKDISTKVRPI